MLRYLLLALSLVLPRVAQAKNPHVLLQTQLGNIEVELDAEHAPVTVANFLRYVNGGFYQGGMFHRVVTMQNQPDN
jgi:peptidyl-prolyl cis-trans isomerase A (cyclophilin A)